MKQDQHHLSKVLNARENRFQLRNAVAKSGFNSLSFTLNIPGYPKSNHLFSEFFSDVLENLIIYLAANRIIIESKNKIYKTDDAGDFYLVPLLLNNHDVLQLKRLTEIFEEKQKLGRLIDIDIFDKEGKPVSSGKEKPCYFCGDHSAVSCMRNKRHSYKEIRSKISKNISTFLEEKIKEKQIDKICNLAQRALLYEISISNKPGLVCFEQPGVHTDMNFFTFLNSTSALAPFFREFCELGYQYEGEINKVLPKIREIGLQAEKAMFLATNKVNTQKGIVFLFGITLFSIANIQSKNSSFTDVEFQNIVKKIGANLVKNELNNLDNPLTHGEKVYKKYGEIGAGIRQEIESGLPTIFKTALPYFSKNLNSEIYKDQVKLQEVLLNGLLQIMLVNNDSNILFRGDLETLNYIQKTAKKSLTDPKAYEQLKNYCSSNNISPGGTADLLAVSLFLHFTKTENHEF